MQRFEMAFGMPSFFDIRTDTDQYSKGWIKYMLNSEKIAVITDSCADIPKEWRSRYHIFVLPLIIRCEDGEHHDGVDITSRDVYKRLETELPKTSTPSGEDIERLLTEVKKQGFTKAVAVMLSGGLSGTVNHLRLAAEETDGLEVAVFDSHSGSIGIGATAIMAAEYIEQGMGFEDVKKRVKKLIGQTHIFFSVDTLEHLKKGGRIGKVTAMAGRLLNIKPILSVDRNDGEIYTASKVRGHKAVARKLQMLVKEVYESGRPYNLMIADGGVPEEGDELEREMKALFKDYHHFIRVEIGATLSVYIGSGVLGAAIQYID